MWTQESEPATCSFCLDQPSKKCQARTHTYTGVSWFGLWLTALTERLPLAICFVVSVALGSRFRTHQISTNNTIHNSNNQSLTFSCYQTCTRVQFAAQLRFQNWLVLNWLWERLVNIKEAQNNYAGFRLPDQMRSFECIHTEYVPVVKQCFEHKRI